eukprot:jgi/Psemu1/15854/gm1.15854_g
MANGGNGYSEDMRKHTLIRYGELGRLINNIESLPAARTARRYKRRVRELGRNVQFRHSGNKQRDDIIGLPMLLLEVYRKIHPKATRYECLAFLWRSYGSYLPKGSTTANQAFTFRNLYKRFQYWTMDYPFGIADICRDDMINVDEAGIKLEHANKKMGKCSLCGRIAIAGNQEGQRWVRFDTVGTDVFSFDAFIESILEDLPPGIDGNRKCSIMDNLLAHHNPLTLDAIIDAGHRFVFRAPYYPVNGSIEYVFNTIEMALSYQIPGKLPAPSSNNQNPFVESEDDIFDSDSEDDIFDLDSAEDDTFDSDSDSDLDSIFEK